jgi:chromosome segregation ATPase
MKEMRSRAQSEKMALEQEVARLKEIKEDNERVIEMHRVEKGKFVEQQKALTKRLSELEGKLANMFSEKQTEIFMLQQKLKTQSEQIRIQSTSFKSAQGHIDSLRNDLLEMRTNERAMNQEQMKLAATVQSLTKKNQDLGREVDALRKKLEFVESESGKKSRTIAALRADLNENEQMVEDLKEHERENQSLRRQLESCQKMMQQVQGLRQQNSRMAAMKADLEEQVARLRKALAEVQV